MDLLEKSKQVLAGITQLLTTSLRYLLLFKNICYTRKKEEKKKKKKTHIKNTHTHKNKQTKNQKTVCRLHLFEEGI